MVNGLLSRLLAAILLAFLFGFLVHQIEAAKLSRMQTMSLQEIADHEKLIIDHGYPHTIPLVAVVGIFYMFLIEAVAFVLRIGCARDPVCALVIRTPFLDTLPPSVPYPPQFPHRRAFVERSGVLPDG